MPIYSNRTSTPIVDPYSPNSKTKTADLDRSIAQAARRSMTPAEANILVGQLAKTYQKEYGSLNGFSEHVDFILREPSPNPLSRAQQAPSAYKLNSDTKALLNKAAADPDTAMAASDDITATVDKQLKEAMVSGDKNLVTDTLVLEKNVYRSQYGYMTDDKPEYSAHVSYVGDEAMKGGATTEMKAFVDGHVQEEFLEAERAQEKANEDLTKAARET